MSHDRGLINNQLEKLQLDLVDYRDAVDNFFSSAIVTSTDWQQCFREILICASQLYLDYLLVMENLPSTEGIPSKNASVHIQQDTKQERTVREQLQQKLESSACWTHQFNSENSFSELTGLRRRQDYADKFMLHLPEIYGESFRIEACAKKFLASPDSCVRTQLVVGLQHLGRNHISFVLQALEWAAEEDSWTPLADPEIS